MRYLIKYFMDADSGEVSQVYVTAPELSVECDCDEFVEGSGCAHAMIVVSEVSEGRLPINLLCGPRERPNFGGDTLEERLAKIDAAVRQWGAVDVL